MVRASVAQLADRRIDGTHGQPFLGDHAGQRPRRNQEGIVAQAARLGHDGAQTHTGEDEHVVRLADGAPRAADFHVATGAAGGHDGASLGPLDDVRGARLGAVVGIGEWQHDRLVVVAGHGADELLAEGALAAGRADQHGRAQRAGDCQWVGEVGS